MAYRRRNGPQRSMTFIEDFRSPSRFLDEESPTPSNPSLPSPQLAAHAIRASAAHRDNSTLSSARDESLAGRSSGSKHLTRCVTYATPKDSVQYEYTSMNSLNEAKYGFWGVLARKAKSILEDDNNTNLQSEEHSRSRQHVVDTSSSGQLSRSYSSRENYQRQDAPLHNRGSEIASSLQHIGGTIKNALEVANAMAAKAKLLMRELKTVKADLAFAKERCAQLEDENKLLRENRKSDSTEDDDLIRLQLETLLEEKGRLAHENSIYARENRFLHEIVEYHQLTMQDVVYVDEGIDELTEFCPMEVPRKLSPSPQRFSPILSRSASLNNSNNSSPPHSNILGTPGVVLTTNSDSPSSPKENTKKNIDTTTRSSLSPSSPSSPRENTKKNIDTTTRSSLSPSSPSSPRSSTIKNNETKAWNSVSPPCSPKESNAKTIEPKVCSSVSPSSSSPRKNNTVNMEAKKGHSSGSPSFISSPKPADKKDTPTDCSSSQFPPREGDNKVENADNAKASSSISPPSSHSTAESSIKNTENKACSSISPPFPLSPRDGIKNVEIKARSTEAASSTPSTPPSPSYREKSGNKAGSSPLSSPKYEVLRRQRSITPP